MRVSCTNLSAKLAAAAGRRGRNENSRDRTTRSRVLLERRHGIRRAGMRLDLVLPPKPCPQVPHEKRTNLTVVMDDGKDRTDGRSHDPNATAQRSSGARQTSAASAPSWSTLPRFTPCSGPAGEGLVPLTEAITVG